MADIDTVRTAGNWSDGLLIIDNPAVVYTARATGAVNQTTWSIGFDGGSGTLGDCLEDMTLLIGSDEGLCDKGIARLRKAPAAGAPGTGTFYIGIDASIVVADNDYLTVLDDFEPFAKHSLDEYLDVDVAYGDQFTAFVPVPWFNGRCVVIKAGETAVFDATKSWIPGGAAITYAWTFTGATATTGTNTATPTATYDNSGRFRVKLTATSGGKSMIGYGFVFVLGENLAAEADVSIDAPEWDAEAGALCTVEMFDRPTIRDGARAIVFSRDWYSGVEQSLGPVAGRKNILIEGRIIGESIIRIPGWDKVEFAIGGPIADLSELAAMVSGLVDKSLPTDDGTTLPAWSKVTGLTVAKGLHYLAVHRSTIARCLDFYVEDWGWACPKLTGSGNSLYQQLVNYAERAALSVKADRLGRIFVERDAQLYPTADRTADIPVVFTQSEEDWQDELTIERRQRGEISMAEAEGEIFSGGVRTKVGGRSPGHQPARHGGSDDLDELYVATQGDVLELAGLLAGSKNQEIERITWRTAQNNRLLDVAPRMYVQVVVDGATLRCIPRNVSPTPNEGTGFWHTEIELEPEGTEWPAVDITYPDDGEAPIPEPPTPPPTPDPWPPEPPTPPTPSGTDAVAAILGDVRTCDDLDQAEPTWTTEL